MQAAALLDQEMMSIVAGQGGCMAAPASEGRPLLCLQIDRAKVPKLCKYVGGVFLA